MTCKINPTRAPNRLLARLLRGLSLRHELVALVMIVSVASIILTGTGFLAFEYITGRQRLERDMTALAEMLGQNSIGAISFNDPTDARDIMQPLRMVKSIINACIYRADGSILASYHRRQAGSESLISLQPDGCHFINGNLKVFWPIMLNKQRIGTVHVQSDMSDLRTLLRQDLIIIAIAILFVTCVSYLLATNLQRVISNPILRLTDTAQCVSANRDYSVRAPAGGQDEIGFLIDTFNSMLAQIQTHQEDMHHLRNYLKNIIDSMPSVLVGVDSDGRVTQWNMKAESVTGISSEQAEGKNLSDVFPQMAREMDKIREAIRTRQATRDAKLASEVDGQVHYSDLTVYPLVANCVEGAVIRIDDVTERVRIEEMMIQSEKMLSVGGLAAGMAHEINNPLAGMIQNAEVVLNRISPDLPANLRTAEECGISMDTIRAYTDRRSIGTMLESIRESGLRAAKIVNNMLSFSRKTAEHFALCNLSEILDQTIELASNDYDLKKKYDFRQIEIVREYAPGMAQVRCEASKIQQVFLNILKNGAQAMSEERRLKQPDKPAPRFILRIYPKGSLAHVEIEDNGPGMTEETRKRVFEPFFTTKSVGVGTGLGLSVSYFIVAENHQGQMMVRSTEGQGTTFTICLPFENQGPARG